MGLFDLFRSKPKSSAQTAKERLLIIVAQERSGDGKKSPDYLPTMKREILEVIRKYINVDPDAVQVNLHTEGDEERLELSVTLPDKK
jgi:cell division topological specificity factor